MPHGAHEATANTTAAETSVGKQQDQADGLQTIGLQCSRCMQREPFVAFTQQQRARPHGERKCAHCIRAERLLLGGDDPVIHGGDDFVAFSSPPASSHRTAPTRPTTAPSREQKPGVAPGIAGVIGQLKMVLARKLTRVVDTFREFDVDWDGRIDKREFRLAMRKLGIVAKQSDYDLTFDSFDNDRSGTLEYRELNDHLRRLVSDPSHTSAMGVGGERAAISSAVSPRTPPSSAWSSTTTAVLPPSSQAKRAWERDPTKGPPWSFNVVKPSDMKPPWERIAEKDRRHRPPPLKLTDVQKAESAERMYQAAIAARKRRAALRALLIAREDHDHGPHRVHPPRPAKREAQVQWTNRMVAVAETKRRQVERAEQLLDAAALEATKSRVAAFTGRDLNKHVAILGDSVMLVTSDGAWEAREVLWRGAMHEDLSGKIEAVEPWVGGRISVAGINQGFVFENPDVGISSKRACERNHTIAEDIEKRKEALERRFYPSPPPTPKLKGARLVEFFERNLAAHEREPDEEDEAEVPARPLSPRQQLMLRERLAARHHEEWRQIHTITSALESSPRTAPEHRHAPIRPMATATRPNDHDAGLQHKHSFISGPNFASLFAEHPIAMDSPLKPGLQSRAHTRLA